MSLLGILEVKAIEFHRMDTRLEGPRPGIGFDVLGGPILVFFEGRFRRRTSP